MKSFVDWIRDLFGGQGISEKLCAIHCDINCINEKLVKIMADVDKLVEVAENVRALAVTANEKVDAAIVKIQELKANLPDPVQQAKVDEAVADMEAAQGSLGGIGEKVDEAVKTDEPLPPIVSSRPRQGRR